jgi:hypothetical protein
VEVPSALTDRHKDGITEAIHHCLIHNTLLHPPNIEFEVRTSAG